MGSCEVLDIALNMRRKAVFVRRPRREFEKRKREFVAQICGDSFWPLSVVFRVIEWRHLTLTKERYWMIGWFGFVEFCRVNAMILQCDSSFWTMKHAQDCDEEHKDACVDGELDDGWWGSFDLFHKGQNRTTLGKSANLTWSLFFFSFWVESDSSQSYCTAFFIFAPPLWAWMTCDLPFWSINDVYPVWSEVENYLHESTMEKIQVLQFMIFHPNLIEVCWLFLRSMLVNCVAREWKSVRYIMLNLEHTLWMITVVFWV